VAGVVARRLTRERKVRRMQRVRWRRWGGEGAGVVVEEEGGAGLSCCVFC